MARIGFHQGELFARPAGLPEIVERPAVDREVAGVGAELRRHVGDDGAVASRERGDAGSEELDETVGEINLPQARGDGQREIGRQHALTRASGQANADDIGHAHRHRHAEHHAFGLEPADAPGKHADPVDHGCVAVGADQRVGNGPCLAVAARRRDDACQPFEVQRVHDAGAGRMHAYTAQRLARPFHEAIPLAIACEFMRHVTRYGVRLRKHVDAERVIGRYVDREHRIEAGRIAAGFGK